MLLPKLFTTLKGYTSRQFSSDLMAGTIVGVVAFPLAIAFGIASGVSPERGLWTAILAGFLISALGGSRVQIGGPTGAFVVIVYGIVQKYGLDGLMVSTFLAGAILVGLGLARLGGVIKFIPYPVTVGFTSGIAVIIFSGQVRDLLGLQTAAVPADLVGKWALYARSIHTVSLPAVGLAAISLAVLVLWPRVSRRVPSPLVALVAGTAVAGVFHLDVETIGSRFGGFSTALPVPRLPHLTFAELTGLVAPAFTIALLGAIESLLSAVVADGMIGSRHRSNMELVAQGVANMVSPIFGGIPATGAIARTATNVKNGGRTPVAGLTHALVLLLITLFLGRWIGRVPLSVLAAILLVVAYHMSGWRTFRSELSAPKSDIAVLLTTFLLTVLVDLTVAIEVGMLLAAFLFMKRMAEVTQVQSVTREFQDSDEEADDGAVVRRRVPKDVEIYEINGPFFFGAAEQFKDTISRIAGRPLVLVVRMRNVPAIDSTGLNALLDVVRRSRREKTLVLLSDVHTQPMMALGKWDALDEIGEENIFGNIDDALNRARLHVGLPAEPPPEGAG